MRSILPAGQNGTFSRRRHGDVWAAEGGTSPRNEGRGSPENTLFVPRGRATLHTQVVAVQVLSLTLTLLLTVTAGCAGIRAPKTMTQGDVSVQLKKRNEEFTQEFEKQRF